ncbi:hypothetical protein KC343_g13324, partial [Hortaea werneckii]
MAALQAEEIQKHPKSSTDRQHLQANPLLGLARSPGVQNPERPSALASRRQQSPRPVETEVAKAKIQTQSDGSDNGGRGATAEAVAVESKARPDHTGDGLVKNMDDGDHVRVTGATSSSTILPKEERWPDAVVFIPCRWFKKAIEDAKGFCEEAEWAESWLEACESGRIMGNDAVDPAVSGSPSRHSEKSGSASPAQPPHRADNSVVSGLWKAVVGETSSPTHKRSELPLLRTAFPKRKQIDAEQGIEKGKLSLESEGAFQAGTVSATVETQPLFTTVYTQSPESYEPGVVQIVDGRSWDSEHHRSQVHIVDDDSPISDIPHNATGGLVPIEALKSPRSPLRTPAPKTTAITRPSVLKRQSTDNTSPKTCSPRYFITNPDTPQSPNATKPDEGPLLPVHKEPGYQPPTSESPKHSPRKSVVFDALPSLIKRESVSASTSPTKVGVAARRRLSQALSSSFHAISTATAPDILEQAEEGQPPFRSTFS